MNNAVKTMGLLTLNGTFISSEWKHKFLVNRVRDHPITLNDLVVIIHSSIHELGVIVDIYETPQD